MHQTMRELKANSRGYLVGKYKVCIRAMIDIFLLSAISKLLVALLFPGDSVFEFIGTEVALFVISCFIGLLQIGMSYMYLKISCGQEPKVSDIFHCFQEGRNEAMGLSLIIALISFVCLFPYNLISFFPAQFAEVGSLTHILIEFIGIVVYMLLSLPISQSAYVLFDFPGCTCKDAIKRSMKLMKGNYFRLIGYVLSFLPLVLLCICSLGIGLIWVSPYMDASLAAFYLDIAKTSDRE